MARYTFFSTKDNTLFIRTDEMLPDTTGMSWRDHCKAIDDAFKLSYDKRLELYGCEACKKEVAEQLKLHKGCKVSEFDIP